MVASRRRCSGGWSGICPGSWAVANRRTRRSRLHVRLRTRSQFELAEMCREHPHRSRSRPVDPTLLVVLFPGVGQCSTSSWWGKRRCPPSDTHFPDLHDLVMVRCRPCGNGAPPQLRCETLSRDSRARRGGVLQPQRD